VPSVSGLTRISRRPGKRDVVSGRALPGFGFVPVSRVGLRSCVEGVVWYCASVVLRCDHVGLAGGDQRISDSRTALVRFVSVWTAWAVPREQSVIGLNGISVVGLRGMPIQEAR
jgi:hypothetical protein